MSATNLTQKQAVERAELIAVDSYTVELDLTNGAGEPGSGTFHSITTVRFSSRTPGASSWIDLLAVNLHTATLNGIALDIAGCGEVNGITLPRLALNNELVIDAHCQYMSTSEGLHRFVDPVDGGVYVCTHFETADAKRMYACFDQPDIKAVYRLRVVAPAEWVVVSNAPCEGIDPAQGGAFRHVFADSARISTYITALVAGPYARWADEYADEECTIPLAIYCRASVAGDMDAERLFIETKQGFSFYHRVFGVHYPFGKYDQIFVPGFNAGAMENAGCVTFPEEYVFRGRVTHARYQERCKTVLHEMAHMWFGNLVTMQWWGDLWLNESFATWASVISQATATDYTGVWTTFAIAQKSWAYRQDQLPSTHPIVCDIPDVRAIEVNFDGITYGKGASVLRQLVAYIGLDEFFAGLRVYFSRHAWGNATLADLLAALEEACRRDLSSWSTQWLKTTGLNILRPQYTVDSNGAFASFVLYQDGARPGNGERRTHRLAIGIYDSAPGERALVRTHRVELNVSEYCTDVEELIGVEAGPLVLVNDDDLTYCVTRLDNTSLTTLIDRIEDITESLPRTLCWSAIWEMTRDAEFRARDFVALVLAGLPAETEVGVAELLLLKAQTALSSYVSEAWATDHGWPQFTGTLMELVNAAEPGSDRQLVLVNALTTSVLGPPELDTLADWLAGRNVPKQLGVDIDLRWRLLHALIAHGAAGEDEISAELKCDATAIGQCQAERAGALIPTPEAKERTWRRAMRDDRLPDMISSAIVCGFGHLSQKQILAPYVDRYFAEIDEMWGRRTSRHAECAVRGLFPSWAVEQRCVEVADLWLAGDQHPSALCRLVSEGRAEVVRALAARNFDHAAEVEW